MPELPPEDHPRQEARGETHPRHKGHEGNKPRHEARPAPHNRHPTRRRAVIPPSNEGGIRPGKEGTGVWHRAGSDPPLKRGRHPAQCQPGVKAPGPGPPRRRGRSSGSGEA